MAKRGSRPRAPRDRRYEWAYLFGAVCPERSTGAAIIMPEVNIEAMNEHLAEISRRVSAGAIALLVLDGAGWQSSPRLTIPDNIALLPLPPYAPELNPVENVWEFLRANLIPAARTVDSDVNWRGSTGHDSHSSGATEGDGDDGSDHAFGRVGD